MLGLASRNAASYDSASPLIMRGNFSYVYILHSAADHKRFYTGVTAELRERISAHNHGRVRHTSKWKPWILKTYIAFRDRIVPLTLSAI
jgi:predicted GIY-YIG superfamily endonuclease